MGFEDDSLTLGLGFQSPPQNSKPLPKPTNIISPHSVPDYEPSLTLSLSGVPDKKPKEPPCSAASNMVAVSVKRERETASSDDLETERGCSRISDEDEDGSCPATAATRKKLRLTKDQSALLEESFKQHSTLNPKQKQALADRLNLRPRQVEVWFQNRRARTKLKQTEVDCEYLKKCCESLTDENRRLHRELQELKALKLAQPLYMHLPAATLSMCPSCERIGAGVPIATGSAAPKTTFNMATKPHFYSSFSNPSAAC